MQKKADITLKHDQFYLSGDLGFSNVMTVYAQSLAQLNAMPELHFDFSELKSSDSSGIALIIEWIKWAKKNDKPIHFHHISTDLLAIAKAAGLSRLF